MKKINENEQTVVPIQFEQCSFRMKKIVFSNKK